MGMLGGVKVWKLPARDPCHTPDRLHLQFRNLEHLGELAPGDDQGVASLALACGTTSPILGHRPTRLTPPGEDACHGRNAPRSDPHPR